MPSILKVFIYSRMMKHCQKFQNLWTDKCMCLFPKNTNRLIRKLSDSPIAIYLIILQKKNPGAEMENPNVKSLNSDYQAMFSLR